jgi:hypothetical protein
MSYRDFQEKWEKMGKVILVVYKWKDWYF